MLPQFLIKQSSLYLRQVSKARSRKKTKTTLIETNHGARELAQGAEHMLCSYTDADPSTVQSPKQHCEQPSNIAALYSAKTNHLSKQSELRLLLRLNELRTQCILQLSPSALTEVLLCSGLVAGFWKSGLQGSAGTGRTTQ